MVIFVARTRLHVTISLRWGALTNRTRRAILGTRRRSDPGFEAWIADEEGSIGVRHWRRAFGRRRALGVEKNNEGLLRIGGHDLPEGEDRYHGAVPVSGNSLWTSVCQVATLTLCAAC
ncbi:hypothetical protein GCM10010211_30490 [Streptomyces albospinus]|uniref:Transposase n=1 Tax=Streptomyces albospinus TaxID=285515 RepID=A0ABQ2V2T9_9ACTN|nr:hypothetical protein GCM10010211_30490 [Streptomyces albospinus]